jgi:hypothetical protein
MSAPSSSPRSASTSRPRWAKERPRPRCEACWTPLAGRRTSWLRPARRMCREGAGSGRSPHWCCWSAAFLRSSAAGVAVVVGASEGAGDLGLARGPARRRCPAGAGDRGPHERAQLRGPREGRDGCRDDVHHHERDFRSNDRPAHRGLRRRAGRADSRGRAPVPSGGTCFGTAVLGESGPEGSGQGQDRTADPTLFRRVLYQLSYLTGRFSDPDGTRTRDLRRDRAAR